MTTAPTLAHMKRWTAPQIDAAIRTVFTEQREDIDFAHYESRNGVLLRANAAMTPELIAVERQYRQFGLVKVEYRDFQTFPVSGVFTQGIEGYAVCCGNLYRLLNLARLTPFGALKYALFEE